jgi:hypothetical protein
MVAFKRLKILGASCLALLLALPAGAVEIHPYGFLLAGYVESWGRTNNAEVPTQATSAGTLAASNQKTSVFTARQSRLGLNLVGGKGPKDSDLSGALEADFYGLRNTGTSSLDAMASAPRLRLAYIQAKRGSDTVVFGQDWTKAFSPLIPTSLMHVGAPALSNSGNLWNRIPQLRWDRAWGLPADWAVNTKLAVVRSFTGDETGRTTTAGGTTFAVPNSVDTAGSGEFSGGPAYQALAQIQKKIDGRVFLAGVSGQYLRESFNAAQPPPAGAKNNQVAGWLWSAHFDLPVCPMLELTGAAFYGRGDQNQNGLGSVYNDQGTLRQSLARGGWAQATVRPIKDLRFNAMAGFESIDQLGLAAGTIYRNESSAVNAMWDVSPELTLAVELGRIHSYYLAALSGDSENLGFSAQYKF